MRAAREAWRLYTDLLARKPLVAQSLQSATLWSVGDVTAQAITRWQQREELESSNVRAKELEERRKEDVLEEDRSRSKSNVTCSTSKREERNESYVSKSSVVTSDGRSEIEAKDSNSHLFESVLDGTERVHRSKLTEGHDFKRTALTALYAAAIAAPLGHLWYRWLHGVASRRFASGSTGFVAAKVFVDTFVFGPVHVLEYFTCMHVLEGGSFDSLKKKIQLDLLPTFAAECMYWPPVQWFNFKLVPVQHQLLAVNVASLVDTTFLSWVKHTASETSWVDSFGLLGPPKRKEKSGE